VNQAEALAGRMIGPRDGDFVIAEWSDGGGGSNPPTYIAPLHVHHGDDEAWYVLEGALRFLVDEEEVEAEAGAAVFVPRGTPHAYWNPRKEPARYLLVMTPRIAHLIEVLHAGPADREAYEAIFREHASELLA
jgi:mannose-6-phosphate isomerase-like protein (cupin superfamily)